MSKSTKYSVVVVLSLTLIAGFGLMNAWAGESVAVGDFPVWVELKTPQIVTVVIEDATGKRVRNLVGETKMPAGRNLITWDGYDDGTTEPDGTLTRHRVAPGKYTARGLVHDGVKTIYEFTVYGGGRTPWPTEDNTGAWLGDHSTTLGATFIPSGSPYGDGKPQVLLVARIAECGAPLVWLGSDGEVYQRRPLWGWEGGDAAATDVGANRDPRFYAYVLVAGDNAIRVRGLTVAKDSVGNSVFDIAKVGPDILTYVPKKPLSDNMMRQAGVTLSVHDGLMAFTVPNDNAVVLADVRTGAVLNTVSIPAPKGVLLLSHDSLLVSTSGGVKRFALTWTAGKPALGAGTVVLSGLEDPRTIQTDSKRSRLYVADWGKSNQVKVFNASTFKPILVIGQPGGLQVGAYNELQMQHPNGLALDDAGQLWVAEADWMPKRVSIWDAASGKLKRAHYGPPHYGGGGTIDPTDKTRLFYGEFGCTLEFKLDWKSGQAKLVAIPVRIEEQHINHPYGDLGYGPEVPWQVNGRTYLSLAYQTSHRFNDSIGLWLYDDAKKTALPVSYVGGNSIWVRQHGELKPERYNELKTDTGVSPLEPYFGPLTCWTDANGDGCVTRNELKFRLFPEMDGKVTLEGGRSRALAGFNFFAPLADLSLCGSWNSMIPPPTFRPDGVPVYDLSKVKFMVPPSNEQCGEEDGYSGILTEDGFWIQGSFKGYKDGKLAWSYPVEKNQGMPPRFSGQVVEPTRLMGPYFKMKKGEAGVLGVINGERGNMYIMTSDGLIVQTIGGHRATADLFRFPKAERGMDVSGASFEDEHFHPTVTHTVDDEVYLVAGKESSSIFRLDGLQGVQRRQFGEIVLAEKTLAALPQQQVFPGRKAGRNESIIVIPKKPLKVDGQLDDWAGATWNEIGQIGTGALAIRDGKLYAAWKTGNPKVLVNGASDPEFAFKRGGAVDLMIGKENRWGPKGGVNALNPIPGDQRLLFCQVGGRNLVVLFRQTAWGKKLGKPQHYESPIGQVLFEDVAIITDQVQMAQVDGNVEISVPLKLLDLPNFNGNADEKLLGDMGILRGTGLQTTLRTYWNNPYTAMVSDIPTEAKLEPANWGNFKIVANEDIEKDNIVLSAKTAKRIGSGIQLKNLSGDDYSIGYWSNPADYLEWKDLPVKPGLYEVEVRYGCANARPNAFSFECGSQTLRGETENTNGWESYVTRRLGTLDIRESPASFTLRALTANGGLMDFKAVRLIPVKK